jgi:hypothetical protein
LLATYGGATFGTVAVSLALGLEKDFRRDASTNTTLFPNILLVF